MSKRLAVSRAAQSDIEDIYDYTLATWGRSQADDYVTQLEHSLTAAAAGEKALLPFAEWQANAGYMFVGKHTVFVLHERNSCWWCVCCIKAAITSATCPAAEARLVCSSMNKLIRVFALCLSDFASIDSSSTREPQNFIQKAQILAVLNNSVCASTCRRLRFDRSEAIETSVQTGLRLWFCLGTRRSGFGWLGDRQWFGFGCCICLCAD